MPRAALFDLDRTLVRRDTASLYVRYRREQGEATWRDTLRVAWWLLQYGIGVIDAERVASRAAADYAGKSERWMIDSCEDWFRRYVLAHVSEEGRRAVARHRAEGDACAIVTGATRYAAVPLARELGIEHVVCSELEIDARGCFTGRMKTLCYGAAKIGLARRAGLELEDAAFYTDSITDRPLLEAVARPVAVNPDPRLRRLARTRGWEVQTW